MNNNCSQCGADLEGEPDQCTSCGSFQDSFVYTSKTAAAVLAFFGGNFGLHRFYLGQWWGIFYLILFWTYIPGLIGFIEALVFAFSSQHSWNEKYNKGLSTGTEKGGIVLIFIFIIFSILVIGILAAIALPAYQDYTIRARMAEPMAAAAEIKSVVSEHALRENKWPEDLAALNIDYQPTSPIVKSVVVDNGVIYIEVDASSGVEGKIILVPAYDNGSITWSCSESTVHDKYLPSSCRQ